MKSLGKYVHSRYWRSGWALFLLLCMAFILLVTAGCSTSAHQAAEVGDLERLQVIIEKDPAQMNARDSYGKTPLHWAIEKDRRKAVELLIDKGANLDIEDNSGHTPLTYALTKEDGGRIATMLILKGAKISGDDDEVIEILKRVAPLHEAAADGEIENVKLLLERFPGQLDARDERGWTPLYHAARHEHLEVCAFLLDRGADINAASNEGFTPLHTACYNENPQTVELLIKRGAEINVQNKDGETPLHWAARRGRSTLIEPLLKAGARLDITDNNGKTPLDWAEDNETKELLRKYEGQKGMK